MKQKVIKKLQIQDLDHIYTFMEEDFPPNELKPLGMIKKSFETGFMNGYGFYEIEEIDETDEGKTLEASEEGAEEHLLAYALFVCIDNTQLFDYLAVIKEYRDTGVGSSFLGQLREILADRDCVIGEVENPDYCEDENERKTMQRRIAFYKRNGVRDTGASGCVYGAEYRFFELEGFAEHNDTEALAIMEKFYRTYWPADENFHKYVQFHE